MKKAPKSAFKKGHKGYWLNKELSSEHKEKISQGMKKHFCPGCAQGARAEKSPTYC